MGGFVSGMGKGVLGLVVKPVVGATDLVTDTLTGINSKTKTMESQKEKNHEVARVRAPRAFQDGVILIYYVPESDMKGYSPTPDSSPVKDIVRSSPASGGPSPAKQLAKR